MGLFIFPSAAEVPKLIHTKELVRTISWQQVNDELTSKYEINYESDFQIKVINIKTDDIGIGATLLTRTYPPKFSSVHLYSTDAGVWSSGM